MRLAGRRNRIEAERVARTVGGELRSDVLFREGGDGDTPFAGTLAVDVRAGLAVQVDRPRSVHVRDDGIGLRLIAWVLVGVRREHDLVERHQESIELDVPPIVELGVVGARRWKRVARLGQRFSGSGEQNARLARVGRRRERS